MNKVAVYGSLREGLHNHRVLGGSECLGTDKLKGFSMFSLGSFPFITPEEEESPEIAVEVYEVNESVFASLDRLEGYPSFYDRKEVDTIHGKCWIYFIEETDERRKDSKIESGDWKEFYYS